MGQDTNLLGPILDNPRMPALLTELTAHWKSEQERREEFYEKIQPGDKWEFINGKIIMHSPAKDKHTNARENLGGLMRFYVDLKELGKLYSETSLVALTRNDYLSDIVFFSKEKAKSFKPDTWKYPVPDFVVEVLSDSTESKDRGVKKEDYAAHKVKEYWIVDANKHSIEQFLLDEEKEAFWLFAKKTLHDNIECQTIKGLVFPVAAVFDEKVKLLAMKGWMGLL